MIATLRFIGVINASIWFGSAIFFSFVGGPAVFSDAMKALLGAGYPVYSGAIAQVIIERYFILQHVCGAIALLHLFGEWLYTGRPLNRVLAWVLSTVFCLGLLGGLGMQPHMKRLHLIKYGVQTTAAQKAQAASSFRSWHAVSQIVNLLVIAALLYYVWQISKPPPLARFTPGTKFRS